MYDLVIGEDGVDEGDGIFLAEMLINNSYADKDKVLALQEIIINPDGREVARR
jgi:hypothetical protein